MNATCDICPHMCSLSEGQVGFCRARKNIRGIIESINYGRITSIAMDPIEKKPLRLFHPGSKILSVGSFGCNLRCPFCQNHEISMSNSTVADTVNYSPEALVQMAARTVPEGNIGIAFTYNEPFIGYEYVSDTARLARSKGLETVMVSNGYVNETPLRAILPNIRALNIDLKSFSNDFYQRISGDLETVKRTIQIANDFSHVEITTLIIPGENDSEEEMRAESEWIAGIDSNIPLHITRFFPRYKMTDKEATPFELIEKLADIASSYLAYVFY
ncbi:MAG: AmmeMemoRadiSam system radical SAM enzyme [Clostridiaceae bacterium]|nr:AmmeMemoRadiSam system radical SAM enzyme [Clostridiaceae bacterium]